MAANPEQASTGPADDARIVRAQDDRKSNAPAHNDEDDVAHTIEEDVDRGIIVRAGDVPEGLHAPKKKKKKSKKPASKRGLGKPTGFEEYHADGPLTPEQALESKEAFHPDVPFVDRVLKAIQRFERTRKLSPERSDIFYKYLAYGGVDVGPNMFMGAQDTNDMDKDNINATLAQANITEDAKKSILDPKQVEGDKNHQADVERSGGRLRSAQHLAKYVVDFEGTMRGFLSRHAPSIYLFDTLDNVSLVTTTLERFMDFLLQHEVCPEYATEVLCTRNLCRTARTELWHCAEAQRALPGDFNIACSTLFGGSYARNYDGETAWGLENVEGSVFVGLKPEQATQIVGFAIAGAATEEVYANYLEITTGESKEKDFDVVKTVSSHGFEIIKLEPPTKECLNLYKENTSEFRPVGRVYAEFFENPNAPPEDSTVEELALLNTAKGKPEQPYRDEQSSYIFFIESKPLFSLLKPGMRIEATIHELNCGVWFFDEVVRVLPSFDLWLENELMLGWREPRPMAGVSDVVWNVGGTSSNVEDVGQVLEVQEGSSISMGAGNAIAQSDVHTKTNQDANNPNRDGQNADSEVAHTDTNDDEHRY